MIKGILFDFDDTLSPGPKGGFENWPEVANKYHLSQSQIKAGKHFVGSAAGDFFNSEKILAVKNLEQEKAYQQQYFQTIAEFLHLEQTDYVDFMVKRRMHEIDFLLYDDILPTIHLLKQQNFKTAIMADSLPSGCDIIEKLNLKDYFEMIYISCLEGMNKLNPNSFQLVTQILNLKPEETLFIDNKEKNLKVAADCNIQVLLMDREKGISDSVYRIIHNLKELAPFLKDVTQT